MNNSSRRLLMVMMNAKNIGYIFLMLFTSTVLVAQQEKDTIVLQREARALLRDGNELYKKERYVDASVSYRKALEKNATYKKASYNLGNAFYQQKNYKGAVPQYELTTKTSKDIYTNAEAFHNIGNAMLEQKQYQQAVDAFKNSLRNNSKDDETRYNLAVAQKLLKKEKDKKKNKKDDKDKKDGDDKKDKKDPKKDDGKKDPKKQDKDKKKKPKQGKMSPQQIKQLLESLNNEEKKTQKKMNAKKAKGKKVKREKDW